VPQVSLTFGARNEETTDASADAPLATYVLRPVSTALPLAGTAAASGTPGPFAPKTGRPIVAALSGAWIGSVTLQRSIDSGATKLPLTFINDSAKGV